MDESTLGIIGGAIGVLAAIGGVWAAAWAMGWTEYLGGKKRPSTIAPLSQDELKRKLLALNSPDLPYHLQPGEESDLQLIWNIADARWYGLISKERLRETYRAFLLLDDLRRSVRYYEELVNVEWSAGIMGLTPKLTFQKRFFKGRVLYQKGWGAGYGVRTDGTAGKVYEYKYDIGKLRDPIQKAVIESGWEFVPVLRKGHATYKKS